MRERGREGWRKGGGEGERREREREEEKGREKEGGREEKETAITKGSFCSGVPATQVLSSQVIAEKNSSIPVHLTFTTFPVSHYYTFSLCHEGGLISLCIDEVCEKSKMCLLELC